MIHKIHLGSTIKAAEIGCAPLVLVVTKINDKTFETDNGLEFDKQGKEKLPSHWRGLADPHFLWEIDCNEFNCGDSWEKE